MKLFSQCWMAAICDGGSCFRIRAAALPIPALVPNSLELAQKCRMISLHGSRVKYEHEVLGGASRLDSLQAAILSVKFETPGGLDSSTAPHRSQV